MSCLMPSAQEAQVAADAAGTVAQELMAPIAARGIRDGANKCDSPLFRSLISSSAATHVQYAPVAPAA
jgi:hypothetical protein